MIPSNLNRFLPDILGKKSKLTAEHFDNILQFYAPVLLKDTSLPNSRYKLFISLKEIWCLLKKSKFSVDDVNTLRRKITKFIYDWEKYVIFNINIYVVIYNKSV